MTTTLSVPESNISVAWAKAFLALMEPGGAQRHPALITVSGLDDGVIPEHPHIRARLDKELKRRGENSCATTASTIFPYSMWNPALVNDAETLYKRYDKAWPGIGKCQANRKGVYFRRLTAYQPENHQDGTVNQLQFIIDTYRKKGNHRKSALQASILDPTRDHTHNRQKGFPCLQQVSFTPLHNGVLSVTGFYATQY